MWIITEIKKYGAVIKTLLNVEIWVHSIAWIITVYYSYFLAFFFSKPYPRRRLYRNHNQKVKKPVCIVTGASSGLGACTAKALAAEGFYVVLVGRSSSGLYKTIQDIMKKNGSANLKAFQFNLSTIESIIKFEKSFKRWLFDSDLHPSLQLLVNNAGIYATECSITKDGYDQIMETNYLSVFVLTNLLLPLLKKSPVPARIVNVSSSTHRTVLSTSLDRKKFICHDKSLLYPGTRYYQRSKLFTLLFAYELHRRLSVMDSSSKISVNVADPGIAETNILREYPWVIQKVIFIFLRLLLLCKSAEEGARSSVDAALASHEVSGKYFYGGKGRTIKSSLISYNVQAAEELWNFSNELLGEAIVNDD